MSRTKIIVTLGPSTSTYESTLKLVKAGASGFRLNFSHGSLDEKRKLIENVRLAERKLKTLIPIIADLTGPSVRTGNLTSEFIVEKGDRVEFRPISIGGDGTIPLSEARVYEAVEDGDTIYLDDGKVVLKVERVGSDRIACRVVRGGNIRSRMSLAIVGKEIHPGPLTEKDLRDLRFSLEMGVEYVALSFVRRAEDVRALKDILSEKGFDRIRVIAKIETRSAVENLGEIVRVSDVVMVARGDLGLYFPLEEIPAVQKRIMEESLSRGRPVIVATQLLESMMHSPIPTRSEVVDVMTAVKEGADALMLTGETAIGRYPVEAVRWLKRIISASERIYGESRVEGVDETLYDKFVKGIVLLAESMNAKIVAYSRLGNTPRRLSRYRPRVPVYVVTGDLMIARQAMILRGITPFYSEDAKAAEDLWMVMRETVEKHGRLTSGDVVIYTVGLREGATDVVKIETIA